MRFQYNFHASLANHSDTECDTYYCIYKTLWSRSQSRNDNTKKWLPCDVCDFNIAVYGTHVAKKMQKSSAGTNLFVDVTWVAAIKMAPIEVNVSSLVMRLSASHVAWEVRAGWIRAKWLNLLVWKATTKNK